MDKNKSKQQLVDQLAELRQQVALMETVDTERKVAEDSLCKAYTELKRLVQELETHQIELQMQNEALRVAQAELDAERMRYFDLYDLAPVGYLTLSGQGLILEANLTAANLLGVARGELAKQSLSRFILPEDQDIDCHFRERLSATGEAQICELRTIKSDATVFWIRLQATTARITEGERIYWAVMSDITERKQAEEALQQSHEELQTIHDGIVEGLLITDIETKRFVRVNSSMCRMLGYSEKELLAASIKDIHPPEEVLNDLDRFQAAAEGRVSINEDRPVLRKDGSVFFADITGHRILYDGRPCLLALFRDITERKTAQEAIQRQHQTLKHLLQSSDHERQLIAYEIHDELAQKLAGAIMQFQTFAALKDSKPAMATKAYDAGMTMLQQGHYETRRLIAGIRPPILDESGVVEAIAHLVNEQNRHKGANIEYRSGVRFDRLVPTLENSIYRIAQEGLTNACQHSQSKKVRISLLQREDWVRIEVRDWGVGFDPTAKRDSRFGLEGIHERARLLGGRCKISSSPGKGTRIIVELPVVVREEDE